MYNNTDSASLSILEFPPSSALMSSFFAAMKSLTLGIMTTEVKRQKKRRDEMIFELSMAGRAGMTYLNISWFPLMQP